MHLLSTKHEINRFSGQVTPYVFSGRKGGGGGGRQVPGPTILSQKVGRYVYMATRHHWTPYGVFSSPKKHSKKDIYEHVYVP